MAQARIDLHQPEAAKTRTELTLSRIGRAWQLRVDGPRFTRALVDFLRTLPTSATVRAYSYAILELFEYFERTRKTIPTPAEVSRADAAEFAQWLRRREQGLTRFRLLRDPRRRMDLAIFDFVAAHPGARIDDIRAALGRVPQFTTTTYHEGRAVRMLTIDAKWGEYGGLGRHLACLVRDRTLERSPSVAELRRRGLPVGAWPDPALFRYQIPAVATAAGSARASGMVARLTALSSFWSHLCRSGENLPGATAPLLRYNVWTEPLRHARGQAVSHQAVSRASKTPTIDLFVRLLATTYQRTHGPGARAAAELAAFSREVPPGRGDASYADLRDRAVLLMMLQPGGPRVSELAAMRRGDLDPASDLLTITGKGGKQRVVRIPAGALDAIGRLTRKLEQLARHQQRYRAHSRAAELLRPEAPLLPAIRYWGRNAGVPNLRGLSRAGFTMMLRRRARNAGVDPLSGEFKRVHPHGFRHLFAKVALESGTPIHVVQALMGHASGATTLRYAEERAPEKLVAEAFRGVGTTPPPRPVVMKPPTTPQVREIKQEVVRPSPPLPAEPEPVEVLSETVEPDALVAVGAPPLRPLPDGVATYWRRRLGRVLGAKEREQLAACEGAPTEAEARLCGIYALDWGERSKGSRERLAVTKAAEGGIGLAIGAALRQAERAALGEEEEEAGLVSRGGSDRLVHTYVGTDSGLVWWSGHEGRLDPDLPVPSAAQLGTCDEDEQSELCAGLAALWRRWMGGGTPSPTGPAALRERGPTAACALVGWVGEMLEEAAQVDGAIRLRDGRWVSPNAPWAETEVEEGELRTVFREQETAQVLAWFEGRAWQYRTGRGRVGGGALAASARAPKVKDTLPEVPAWYGEVDPIASMDPADRAEALDLMRVLTGAGGLRDRTPRFAGASRAELAEVIEALRRYEGELATKRDVKARRKKGESTEREVERATAVAAEAAEAADRIIRAVGGGVEFSSAASSAARVASRKAAGKKRESLADYYLRVVGELFGESAAADPLLVMVAKSAAPVLAPYRELLAPDDRAGTIRHSRRYGREFAAATGAHSECVARRLARGLYELWKSKKKGAAAFKRRKDLLDLVDSMAAVRVPCPAAQERELRDQLGSRDPVGIYERWAEARAAQAPEPAGREAEIVEAIFAPPEEEFAAAREAELRYRENRSAAPTAYTRRAAERLPTPVDARIAVRMSQ